MLLPKKSCASLPVSTTHNADDDVNLAVLFSAVNDSNVNDSVTSINTSTTTKSPAAESESVDIEIHARDDTTSAVTQYPAPESASLDTETDTVDETTSGITEMETQPLTQQPRYMYRVLMDLIPLKYWKLLTNYLYIYYTLDNGMDGPNTSPPLA